MGSEIQKILTPVPKNSLFLSLVIPAYNEGQNIAGVLEEYALPLRAEGIPFELIVVNDNSTDETAHVIEQSERSIP